MEDVARAVVKALAVLDETSEIHDDDPKSARESARAGLEEAAKTEPDTKFMKSSLMTARLRRC